MFTITDRLSCLEALEARRDEYRVKVPREFPTELQRAYSRHRNEARRHALLVE
jgi:hypothetical protein